MPLPFLVSELLLLERSPVNVVVLRTLNVLVVPKELAFRFKFPENERLPVWVVALPNVRIIAELLGLANELEMVRLELSVLMMVPEPLN